MRVAVLVGGDKLGRLMASKIKKLYPEIPLLQDNSSSWKRVFSLLKRNTLSFSQLYDMAFAEFKRSDVAFEFSYQITNNKELMSILCSLGVERLYLYRAGLIINRKALESDIEFYNIHCAKLPQYGGIATIHRALRDKAIQQEATLHHVTEGIDSGTTIDVESYLLDLNASYFLNEERAYEAGRTLLLRQLAVFT